LRAAGRARFVQASRSSVGLPAEALSGCTVRVRTRRRTSVNSVKYEEVYLRAYDTASEARASIGCYLDFHNCRRPPSSLDGTTPDHAYFTPLPLCMAA
jgi:putative transposase